MAGEKKVNGEIQDADDYTQGTQIIESGSTFPSNPVEGQTFSKNGLIYRYNGSSWVKQGPTNTVAGENGNERIEYGEGSSGTGTFDPSASISFDTAFSSQPYAGVHPYGNVSNILAVSWGGGGISSTGITVNGRTMDDGEPDVNGTVYFTYMAIGE